jgi:D-mannonate dehydratase
MPNDYIHVTVRKFAQRIRFLTVRRLEEDARSFVATSDEKGYSRGIDRVRG